jgi:hypothetical protein
MAQSGNQNQRFRSDSHYKKRAPTALTTRHIRELLPDLLAGIGTVYQNRPDLVLAAWPDVIGKDLASMTQALSFNEGILTVKVNNSTLYSLLSQHDKPRILKSLRDKFAGTVIKTIHFQLG